MRISNEKNDFEALAESNIDWSATAAIYIDETKAQPLSTSSLSSSSTQYRHGFCGTVTIPIATSTIAFCRKTTPEGHYRYFSLETTPILKIEFDYIYQQQEEDDNNNNQDDEAGNVLPQTLRLEWKYYPEAFVIHKEEHLSWLLNKCNQQLQEENYLQSMCTSYSVVEFCCFETLSFWETIHQGHGYRLILLPPVMDHLYHSNLGTLIHPKEEGYILEGQTQLNTPPPLSVEDYGKQALIACWKKLYVSTCPICFESSRCDEGITLPCGHFFCNDCFPMYIQIKATELAGYRENPFLCPAEKCRKELPIHTIVKKFLSKQEYTKVQRWKYDIEFPPCYSLDRCLSKSCASNKSTTNDQTKQEQQEQEDEETEEIYMRRCPSSKKTNLNTFMFCKVCEKQWCELCLKRIKRGVSQKEHREVCESQVALKFCRRYLRASDETKALCQEKFPWIATYSRFRQNDMGAINWLMENGQWCPNCSTGVERIEGCFHMKCYECATHFCYECGQELHPPYYGTHHCWEEDDFIEEFQ